MRYSIFIQSLLLLVSSLVAASDMEENVGIDGYFIQVTPEAPTTNQEVFATINNTCGDIKRVEVESRLNDAVKSITVTYATGGPVCDTVSTLDVPLGKLVVGEYDITYILIIGPLPGIAAINRFTVVEDGIDDPQELTFFHESPSQNSLQSGIGLIHGWACSASKVEISIDEGEKLLVPYGGTRGDTAEVCSNDGFNGYAMAYAWGLLADGMHRMQTFVDDVEISDVDFSTVRVDEGFLMREDAEYTLPDFPVAGQQVTIRWQDNLQNFSVISKPELLAQ